MDMRKALLTKLHDCPSNELKDIIEEGIASKEETILPGLGVLFEEYYKSLGQKEPFLMQLSQLLK